MAAHFEPDWQLDRFFAFDVRSDFTLFTVWLIAVLGRSVMCTIQLGIPELSSIFN